MSSSVCFLFESESSLKKRFFVSAISIFVNERVPDPSYEPTFKFHVRNDCEKGRKSEGLYACDKVEIRRFKMF